MAERVLARRWLLQAAGALGFAFWSASDGHAASRSLAAERFVEQHATAALNALGDPAMNREQRRQAFGALMQQFADVPRIANFVLGPHAATLRRDPGLAREWSEVFLAFSMASYVDRLERYQGRTLRATGSVERVPDQDVVVRSELERNGAPQPTTVQWRMLRSGAGWRVADIALLLNGNEVWLAQQQKSQFMTILDRNNSDFHALIANVRQTTAAMEAHARSAG